MENHFDFDALVVGGGSAGLSAALVLGRARVRTLVVDAGRPSNRVAHAIGGLLGQPSTGPLELLDIGRGQLEELTTVEIEQGSVLAIETAGEGFIAQTSGRSRVSARRVLLAGGMDYELPDTPGLRELWGDTAFACPYCHGWEHRDQRIGILGPQGADHRVRLLRGWSKDLVVISGRPIEPEARETIEAFDVPIVETPVESVAAGTVRLAGGEQVSVDALHVVAPMRARDGLAPSLGLETTEHANGSGLVVADRFGATSVEKVFAAGDLVGAGNVAAAVATGNLAATGLHRSLLFD